MAEMEVCEECEKRILAEIEASQPFCKKCENPNLAYLPRLRIFRCLCCEAEYELILHHELKYIAIRKRRG